MKKIEESIKQNNDSIKVLQNQLQNLFDISDSISENINGNTVSIKQNNELLISESKKQLVEINRLGQVISNIPIILSDVIVEESEKQLDVIRAFNDSLTDDS